VVYLALEESIMAKRKKSPVRNKASGAGTKNTLPKRRKNGTKK